MITLKNNDISDGLELLCHPLCLPALALGDFCFLNWRNSWQDTNLTTTKTVSVWQNCLEEQDQQFIYSGIWAGPSAFQLHPWDYVVKWQNVMYINFHLLCQNMNLLNAPRVLCAGLGSKFMKTKQSRWTEQVESCCRARVAIYHDFVLAAPLDLAFFSSKRFSAAAFASSWATINVHSTHMHTIVSLLSAELCKLMCYKHLPSVLGHRWLGSRKGVWPVKTEWWGTGVRYKLFAYGPADATATPSTLASLKSRMVYLSGAGLPRKKGC